MSTFELMNDLTSGGQLITVTHLSHHGWSCPSSTAIVDPCEALAQLFLTVIRTPVSFLLCSYKVLSVSVFSSLVVPAWPVGHAS
jgi:hypothetical protein